MKERCKIIFDMDGTLYRFDKGQGDSFVTSRLYNDLKNTVYDFFMSRLGLTKQQSVNEYERVKNKYNGEVSLGVEMEYGINRYDYFNQTWGKLDSANYIETNKALSSLLIPLKGDVALLTSAPRVWVDKVINQLELQKVFGEFIYTGEPNLRKPDPQVFRKIANEFRCDISKIFSIGDQEVSDIIPAKSIGMRTIHIGQGLTSADYQSEDVLSAINLLKKEGFL